MEEKLKRALAADRVALPTETPEACAKRRLARSLANPNP